MEVTKRELYSNLLLAIYAAKKNFNVYLSDSNTYKLLISKKLISPGIIHTKSIVHGKKKAEFHKELFLSNFIITAIDEEHGVLDNLDYIKYFASNRLSDEELKKISAFFCWGKYDFKKLKKNFNDQKNKFFLTGSPRTDIWKNSKLFSKKEDLYHRKPTILICTNFSFANNITSYKSLIKKKRNEGYYKRSPGLLEKNKKFYFYQKKLIPHYISLINSLSKKYPNYKICVRPHPTENLTFWRKKLITKRNLFIDNSKTSTYWIQNCKYLIQTGCTTGSEGIISNKIVINYIPIKSKIGFGDFLKKISFNAKNEIEVCKIIDSKKLPPIKFKSKLNERIFFRNNAAKKITKIWFDLSKKIGFNENNQVKIRFYLFIYENIKNILRNLNLILKGKQKKFQALLNYKYPEFSESFIINETQNLSKSFNLKGIKIKKLGKKLFHFTY